MCEEVTRTKRPATAQSGPAAMSPPLSESPSTPTKANQKSEALMNDFARFLCNEEPDVFQNVFRVKRLLELTDRHFRDGNDFMESFFSLCTQDIEDDCWTFSCHRRLNTVLMPRGIEMISLHENAFALQTLENTDDVLIGRTDLLPMCICIWLLRTHSCISKVVLNVATVARFHVPEFWRLLSFNTAHLDQVELRGLMTDESHFGLYPLFVNASKLTELIIVDMPLNNMEVSKLCLALFEKKRLQRLVLKYVGMTTTALQLLGKVIPSCCRPMSLEWREKIRPCESYEIAAASLLDTPVSKLCLEAPCNWMDLFKRLRYNKSLSELEIMDCDSLTFLSLNELADAMLINSTIRRLKLTISFPPMNAYVSDAWRKLTQSIGQNRGLKSLSFASSNFCEESQPMASLAEAIALNKTLVELSVEDCNLSCLSVLFLLDGLSRNETMKTLHLGLLREDEQINQRVLKRVTELGLGERVDCVYELKNDWLLRWPREVYAAVPFRRVRVARTSAFNGDYILNILHHALGTLTSLYVEGVAGVPMTSIGAQYLSDLFANSIVLEHVTLLFDAATGPIVTILDGLASSKSIYSVVVGRGWQLSDEVAITFEETIRKNSSIAELTVWQDTRVGFEKLKAHLRLGVERNDAICKVRLLYGPEKKESHDWALLMLLLSNRVVTSWALDIILGYSMTEYSMSK
ncbi:hypothetical protein HPB49_020102 [Dermacentor silvarum]|uniref:Uncharacterized protein n=1 Tax=Dermacentor silvarum TaxID=543639 RepID=A0ACB8E2T6_DERSI|nr:hypothetical protein HPB49_020102 [Dermacentor silvarum]